jgi:hypothetical protein
MLFNTDLSQEYYEVTENFFLTEDSLKAVILRMIDFIFEKDEQFKNKLREKVKNFN